MPQVLSCPSGTAVHFLLLALGPIRSPAVLVFGPVFSGFLLYFLFIIFFCLGRQYECAMPEEGENHVVEVQLVVEHADAAAILADPQASGGAPRQRCLGGVRA